MSNQLKNTSLENFDRINYKESELQAIMGPHYNNCMSHKMKDKDTSNKMNPTNGLWSNSILYTTTNNRLRPSEYKDPYLKKEFNIKRNPYKTFEEELQKFKNMGKKLKSEEASKKEEKK